MQGRRRVEKKVVTQGEGAHLRVDLVAHDADAIEAREDGIRQVDILRERLRAVVAPADWVGGGHDGAARLQRGDDASLGDGDRLLLHRLCARRGSSTREISEVAA